MNGQGKGQAKKREASEKAMTRCCKGTKADKSARVKMKEYGGCSGPVNYTEACNFCTKAGLTICTKEQIANKVTKGTGCMYNHKDVWLMEGYQEEKKKEE